MIELIDILDENHSIDILHTEDILKASMIFIQKNIFRTFQNKNNKKH